MSELLRTAPEGGAMMHGRDTDGNPIQLYVAEGITIPTVGTIRFDDNNRPNGYFSSMGWMRLPMDPSLLQMQPYLIPLKK